MNNKQLEELVDLMFDTDMEEVMKEKNTLEYIHKLQQENKQLKSILTELEEYIKKHIEEWENDEDEYLNGVVAEDKDILQLIQELKEKYK